MRNDEEVDLRRGGWVVHVLLFVLVLLSLALNVYLIRQWLVVRSSAEALQELALEEIPRYRQQVQSLKELTFEYQVEIDESLPVDAVVPFRERLDIPIETTVPISQAVETTFDLEIPQFGLRIPVEVTVPVELEVPVSLSVPVEIDRDVPVRTTVPVQLEVPIVIALEDTGLIEYVELLDQGLATLESALSGRLLPALAH